MQVKSEGKKTCPSFDGSAYICLELQYADLDPKYISLSNE